MAQEKVMKTLKFYVFIIIVSAIYFSPVSTVAQKSKPAGDTKSTDGKTDTKSAAPVAPAKTPVQKANETYISSAMEKAVLDEINVARKTPKIYIQYLEDYKKLFKGNSIQLSGSLWFETMEGTAVVDEAINFLKNLPQLSPYSFSSGLNKVVSSHIKDLMETPSLSHKGKDGSDLKTRLARGGTVGGSYAENIAFSVETARQAVLKMIIDDGFKSRSHRKNVFSPNFKVVGIACGKAKSGEGLCVTDFAESFMDGSQKSVIREF